MRSAVEDIIVNKGIKEIWQNPRRDKNCIVQLARISPKNGYTEYGKIHWDVVETPTKKGYYHFYQIGDNYPGDFSLIARKNQWYKLSEWCKVYDLIIRIYDTNGNLFPLDDAYTFRTYNDNIIIAVLRNDYISDINEETLFINFYRNYFYTTAVKDPHTPHVEYFGYKRTNQSRVNDFLKVQTLLQRRQTGKFRLTNNGKLVDRLKPDNQSENGEVAELHYDMSIRKMVDFPINQLRTFKSTLDKKNKYLLHPPKDEHMNTIDYRDDIEIFICHRDAKTSKVTGVYYHRNQEDAVRMVTHRDWSLPVPYVMHFVDYLKPEGGNLDDFFIRVYVRDNGPETDAGNDVNLIRHLYTLSDDKIIEAMVKVDSTVPEWKADNLEQSAYTALMRSYHHEITPALVLDAIGYSGAVKTLANPNVLLKRNPNGNHFIIPVGVRDIATVFEYNQYGLLLGYYPHKDAVKYYPRNKETVFIEVFSGEGKDSLEIHLGRGPYELKPDTGYRFYLANTELDGSIPVVQGYWRDATNDSRILVDNTTCTFNHDEYNELGVCIGDSTFLCYDVELDGTDGIFDFKLTWDENRTQGLFIPPGKIDLFMNGHALIEDIDYYIDFPRVIITAKRYIEDDFTKQKVTVRAMGFPFTHEGILKRVKPTEVGFTQYGKVSVNALHDIHDGQVLRTVVNGGVFDPSVIPFDELGESDVGHFVEDGVPYAVEHPYIALGGTMGVSLYLAQIKEYALSRRIRDYLSLHLPRKDRTQRPVIKDKYEIYSPFLSKIALDLKFGRLKSPLPKITIQQLDKIIEKYKPYLLVDPIIRGYDKDFVNIHAHNLKSYIDLTARDVAFLHRLNDVYLKGEVDVSKFFQVRR